MPVRDVSQLKELLFGLVSDPKSFKIHKQVNKCFDMSKIQDRENQPYPCLTQAILVVKLSNDLYLKHQNVSHSVLLNTCT